MTLFNSDFSQSDGNTLAGERQPNYGPKPAFSELAPSSSLPARSEIALVDGGLVLVHGGGSIERLDLKHFPESIRVGCTSITREAIEYIYKFTKEHTHEEESNSGTGDTDSSPGV